MSMNPVSGNQGTNVQKWGEMRKQSMASLLIRPETGSDLDPQNFSPVGGLGKHPA